MAKTVITKKDSTYFVAFHNEGKKVVHQLVLSSMLTWKKHREVFIKNIKDNLLLSILNNAFFYTTLIQLRNSMKLILHDHNKKYMLMEVYDKLQKYKVKLVNYYIKKL